MGAVVAGMRADDEVDAAVPFPWTFFAPAFGFTWLVCLPGVLAARGLITLPFSSLVLIALAQCGPSLAAGVLVYRAAGRPGVLTLLKRVLAWRIPLGWLVARHAQGDDRCRACHPAHRLRLADLTDRV